jgi:hypothetical protein
VFTPTPAQIGTFNPQDRTGTFTVSFPDGSRPLNSYEVCWAAPYNFKTDAGPMAADAIDEVGEGTIKPGTTAQLYVGTLPDCKRGTPAPCVASRSFKKATANVPATVIITVSADGRDPWRY